ncbi:AAA family ATPase [Methanococcoides methylutens]|uniref:AAA family ATPase n=1 Tax=Methanococcoides methylutens TaxID=2226 RepID=UPI0040451882
MVRSAQKTTLKRNREENIEPSDSTADIVILKPQGYPLSSMLDEYPEIEDPEVFEHYARKQWKGFVARKGEYLFDHRMYPDFAYKILEVEPPESAIGMETTIIVNEDEKTPITPEFATRVTFEDVIGQKIARQKCKLIERFLEEPEKFGKWAPRNVLFFGPSGTGKTMLAKALANKTDVPLLPIKATQLIGEFVGEGARQIHQLYDRAEEMQPCIIFIDELDAIALDRKYQELRGDVAEIVNALLTEMDGIVERQGVCTIGATNRIASLDSAVRSRFEEEIEFLLPDEQDRHTIIEQNINTFPLPAKDIDLKKIAKLTAGLSGRDIVEKVLKNALHQAIIDDREEVGQELFENAISKLVKKEDTGALNRLYI